MAEDMIEKFLKTGSDWGRMKTSVPGVFVLKLPAYKGDSARLAVELNPVTSSGLPTKKRGLVLRSFQELEAFKELFQFDKLSGLLKKVDGVNPPAKKAEKGKLGEAVLEI